MTFFGDHEAGVEAAFIGPAFFCHSGDGRLQDALGGNLHHLVGHDRCRCIGAHAAGVGAFVAVVGALVVLGTDHRADGLAVGEG